MKKERSVEVARALVIFDGKVLLLRRDFNEGIMGQGQWQLPGGGVEDGEMLEEAIARELEEEICVIPSSIEFLETVGNVNLYKAILTEEEAKNVKMGDEGMDLKFFSLEELEYVDLTPKTRGFFEERKAMLQDLVKS